MYFRKKTAKGYSYLQIVEGFREGSRVKQRVIATLGRIDELSENGQLESLLHSAARFSEQAAVIGAHKQGQLQEQRTVKSGPPLAFDRLWEECGIGLVLREMLGSRAFRFDVERAVFLTCLHRLLDPGSDRAADQWKADYALPRCHDLKLHQLYRAMAWLGEVLADNLQDGNTQHSPRCVKDLVEEKLFARRRTLFSELVLCFFDTTTLYFEGEGGQSIGQRGNSKDRRPDKAQMVVGLILDEEGRPVCTELWPGNTTDVKTLLPVVERLRTKFGVKRICIVADRGMISRGTIASLDKAGLHYIFGARMRKHKEVSAEALSRAGRYQVVRGPRQSKKEPAPLKVKEVFVEGRRYVVCHNEDRARKDARDRQAIVEKLEKKLREGPKSMVGNKGFRRYLKDAGAGFELDKAKLRAEARLDGKWVLRTNTSLPASEVAQQYKQLLMVESLFRTVKSVLETRPIYHRRDETIRGHVFCSFLAMVLMRELQDRMGSRGWGKAEWNDVLNDLDNLSETEVQTADGKRFVIRSEVKGWAGKALAAAGVAIPPTVRRLERKEGLP